MVNWVVIPAAGRGSRLPGDVPKQYRRLGQRTVLEHCLAALLQDSRIQGVMLALAAEDAHWRHSEFARHPAVHVCTGGRERADSVLAGLKALQALPEPPAEHAAVLVHDAARALLPAEALDRLLSEPPGADGALLALPAQDSLKWSEDGRQIDAGVERSKVWQAQTPQIFELARLQQALEQALSAGLELTDEASCMTWQGYRPRLVMGDARNFKITTAADLALAGAMLGATAT